MSKHFYIFGGELEKGFAEVTESEFLAVVGNEEQRVYTTALYRDKIMVGDVPEDMREAVINIVAARVERFGEYVPYDSESLEILVGRNRMRNREVKAYRAIIEKAVQFLDRSDALEVVTLHPEWKPGMICVAGMRVQHDGKLYEVKDGKTHTALANWSPDIEPSLFERVDETHSGTDYDPIPYDGNMALKNGLYYAQDGGVYKCTRDTVNAVYAPLCDLVGLYVERL